MDEVGRYQCQRWDEDYQQSMQSIDAHVFACPNCDMPTITAENADEDGYEEIAVGAAGKEFPDVPKHIAATATEAHRCHSIYARRGSIVLARAVLEATCKDKGVTDGTLQAKITTMHQRGLIPDLVRDEVTELRHAGNAVAHSDDVEPVSEAESAQSLSLMDDLLLDVYQRPAKVARLKEAREAAKESSAKGESQGAR